MNGKLARLDDMLGNGWHLDDIVSDHGAIEVLLRRGASRTTLVLDRMDAEEILYGAEGDAPERPRATLVVER